MLDFLKGSNKPSTIDLKQGLVAHYLLNNNADDSYGTYDGAPISIDFQGDTANITNNNGVSSSISSYITIPTLSLSTFTYSFWVNVANIDNNNSIMGRNSTTATPYNFIGWEGEGGIKLGVNGEISGIVPIAKKVDYTNICITKIGTSFSVYQDGIYKGSSYCNAGDMAISLIGGYFKNTNVSNFKGRISNIRVYNEAKDQTFIDALYAEGYYPKPLPLPTTSGLVAYYPLTGTAEDKFGTNNGTENGGLLYVDDVEYGSVADFDGVDDYIGGMSIALTSFSFWLKIDTNKNNTILSFLDSDPNSTTEQSMTAWSSSTIRIYFKGSVSTEYFDILPSWSINTTYHISIVRSNGNWYSYVNGVLTNTLTTSLVETFLFRGLARNLTTTLGVDRFLDGKVWNFRGYNRALTQQEITDIYNYEKNFRYVDIDDGLVAYYPLKKNSLDNYKNQYDGIDTSMSYDGLSGIFNGISSYISSSSLQANIRSSSFMSFSCWVKTNISNSEQYIFALQSGVANRFIRCAITSGNKFGVYHRTSSSAGVELPSITNVVIGTWYHVVAIWDFSSSSIKLYVNGVLEVTYSFSGSDDIEETEVFYLGTNRGANAQFMNGNISRFRPYNKVITAEQVKSIYNSEKGDFI